MNNKIVGIFLGVLLALIFLSNTSLAENSNQLASFNGDAEFFSFNGERSTINFKANSVSFIGNTTVYVSIKNTTIQYYDGRIELINGSSIIQVQYTEKYPQYLYNVEIESSINNFSITKDFGYNQIDIEGSYNYIDIKSKEKVIIQNDLVQNVILNDKNIKDFSKISFETNNRSFMRSTFNNKKFKLNAVSLSDLIIKSDFSRVILYQANGIFGLNDHKFDIKSTDRLNLEILPKYQDKSFLKIDNSKVILYGYTNSAKLNDEDKIMNDVSYWFEEEPEKISVVVTFILVVLTGFNMRSAQKLVSMESEKKKHEKKRFLNIIFAELETNSMLLEDLKKAIENFNKLKKNDPIDFLFLGFKEDGFNAFRNQGGFEYITPETYNLFIEYYNILNKISKKLDISDSNRKSLVKNYIKEGESMEDIEDIETRTNILKEKLKAEMKDS